jgi:hypothetical protein
VATYDHTQAFQEAFGARDAKWFLGKASRELAKYHEAKDTESRVDSLLNFASSLIALEDWSLPQNVNDEAAWRGGIRSESPAHAFIALIALVAKHRQLKDGRFSSLRLENGQIHAWTEEATPTSLIEHLSRTLPSSKVKAVQTRVDDDEIAGYVVILEVDGLKHNGTFVPLEDVMRHALKFWEERL